MDAINPSDAGDFDRELQVALRVNPSPEFVARIRLRIAEEPPAHRQRLALVFGTTALVAIAAIVAIVIPRLNEPPATAGPTAARSESAAVGPTIPDSPVAAVPSTTVRTTAAARPAARAGLEPSIVVFRKDAEALDQYVRSIYAPPIQWTAFSVHQPWPDDWLVPLPAIPQIAVAPLVIEPLSPVAQ